MKMIVGFVRPSLAHRVVRVIERAGLYHLSVSRVHGVVHPNEAIVRADMAPEGEPDIRLEAYCEDGRVEEIVALIREVGRIGELPVGAVFVVPVDRHEAIGAPATRADQSTPRGSAL